MNLAINPLPSTSLKGHIYFLHLKKNEKQTASHRSFESVITGVF